MRHGHAQGAGEGLEDGLGLVVVVVAAGRDLEVAPRGACERVEEVAEHLGGYVADPFAAENDIPGEIDPAAEGLALPPAGTVWRAEVGRNPVYGIELL